MTAGGKNNLFLPEDLVRDIIVRLPTVSTAARLRSVSKTWKNLLSDPKFIFRKPNDDDQLQILITGFGENYERTDGARTVDKIHYSLHSYETLREETRGEISLVDRMPRWRDYVFLGCCDGIFCISRMNVELVSEILLWNPTTSEVVFLPPFPFRIPRTPTHTLAVCHEIVGFGFDPLTNDYKVVHKVEFCDDFEYEPAADDESDEDEELHEGPLPLVHDDSDSDSDEDEEELYEGPLPLVHDETDSNSDSDSNEDEEELYEGSLPLVHTEVYSLKNSSWKTLRAKVDDNTFSDWLEASSFKYVHQQRDISRNEKCYWFHGQIKGLCGILSFDMSKEVFEYIEFSRPPVFGEQLGSLDEEFQRYKKAYSSGNYQSTDLSPGIIFPEPQSHTVTHKWNCYSCFLLKGTFIVTFEHETTRRDEKDAFLGLKFTYEMWGLLKFGVADSWTKLFVFEPEGRKDFKCLEFWKDGTYICSQETVPGGNKFDPEKAKQDDRIFVFDPATEETVGDHRLEIQGTIPRFEAQVFTPTHVSLS
ncbi:Putative F-box protein At3g16210 [Linum grandiflorum]